MKFKKYFINQFYAIKPLFLNTKFFLKSYARAFNKDIKNFFYKPKQIQINDELKSLLAYSDHDPKKIKITFYGAARRKDNSCCNLDRFLKSIIQHSKNLSRIEVLLAIDPDDDISYFLSLKKKFGPSFQFKIFISEKRLGYEKLHLYDAILFKSISPHTKMLADFSDDCFITLSLFDDYLVEIDNNAPDNIYFIHTKTTNREEYLGDVSKNLNLLYWIIQSKAPASYFPIFSRKILEIAYHYAQEHDKHKEWSPMANTWICDCYLDILSTYVKHLGLNRIFAIDMIHMNPTVFSAYHYVEKTYQLTPNHLAFITLLNNQTLDYLKGLAEMVVSQVATPKLQR